MKKIYIISVFCIACLLQACYKPGDIQVQNNISNVKIVDVKWGDIYIATELLPGETSEKLTIEEYREKLPSSHKITFKMSANNKSIYLETVDEYLLDEEDDLLIILSDETEVENPNE